MNTTKQILRVCVLLAAVAFLLAYGLERFWWGAFPAFGLGILGQIGGCKQKWTWIVHIFFAGVIILVTIGVFFGLSLILLLFALLGALAAWDLARFQQRIGDTPISAGIRKIEKRHLGLLGLTLGGGSILTSIVLSIHIQISFGIALAFGVILIIILGQIYRLVS
jgi:hypothetical protein